MPTLAYGNNAAKGISLPANLKCSICHMNKANNNFSSKQISDYQIHRLNEQWNKKGKSLFIRCKACVGGQAFEMNCSICRRTLTLAKFALAQRKNPDAAKCMECMEAIDRVMPAQSNTADLEDLLKEGPNATKAKESDRYYKNSTGEYWTPDLNDDASSVSNVWSNRTVSDIGYRGPIGGRSTQSNFGDDQSVYSETMNSPAPKKHSGPDLTSKNMAALDRQLGKLNLAEGYAVKGLGGKSLALAREDDIDSNDSEDTVRKGDGGIIVPKPDNSQPTKSVQGNSMPNYENPEDEDEDEHWVPLAMKSKAKKNLYDDEDDDDIKQSYSGMSSSNIGYGRHTSTSTVNDHYGSHHSTSHSGYGNSTMSSVAIYGTNPLSSTDNDWKSHPHKKKTFASGFKDSHFKKEGDKADPKKFARVRPTNMRVDDMKKSLLYKNLDGGHKIQSIRKRTPGDAGSDED